MAAYLIVFREEPIRDQKEMDEYSRINRENAKESSSKYKIAPLVVYGATEALEGAKPDGVVVMQFPTMEDAKAWYNSPAYQKALPHRMKAAEYRVIIVEGL